MPQDMQPGSVRSDDHPIIRAADHDVRTPFNVLFGLSEIACDYGDDMTAAQLCGHIASMRTAALLAFRITTRLADYARVLSSLRTDAAFAVAPTFAEMVGAYQARAAAGGVTMHAQMQDDAQAAGDARFVVIAVEAMLDNALRFTSKGDVVQLKVEIADAVIRIVVADDGPGLAAADPFVPGAKNSVKTNDDAPGAGLSLAIAREIARACGGELIAGPGLNGAGAGFTLTLPRIAEIGQSASP